MINLLISDKCLLYFSWDKKNGSESEINYVPFNQKISDILYSESELNLLLSSVLKKINQINPFYDKKIIVTFIDEFVNHSVIENEFDLSNDEKFTYINWVENLKYKSNNISISTFVQTYLPDESNFHVCSISKIFIRTLKLSIIELGGNPSWMGPSSSLILDGMGEKNNCIIYRNGNKYFFLKKVDNRFDLGEITFSGGLPKLIYTTDPKNDLILQTLGIEKSELKKIPVYCFQKLGRNALSVWDKADLNIDFNLDNNKINNTNIKEIPIEELNILTCLRNNKAIEISFNFFGEPGIIESQQIEYDEKINNDKIIEEDDYEESIELNEEVTQNNLNKIKIKEENEVKNINKNNSSRMIFTLFIILGLFVFFNFLRIKNELNNATYGLKKGFKIERVEKYNNKGFDRDALNDSKELLMQSKSISAIILSLFTETELNRYNALTITKSFISLEYLSGVNPNIENILGINPTSFSVEAVGKDSTIFLWYYSFDLPLLSGNHISGEISKLDLIEKLHKELTYKPAIRYFEKVYTKYQIYGPLLIRIKDKADILHASSIISNMDDTILLRKFVLFNDADRPNPRANFYLSILED